jgi:hypothetical protein
MKHDELRWNADLEEWYCTRCGRSSDQHLLAEAQAEIELFDCNLPVDD